MPRKPHRPNTKLEKPPMTNPTPTHDGCQHCAGKDALPGMSVWSDNHLITEEFRITGRLKNGDGYTATTETLTAAEVHAQLLATEPGYGRAEPPTIQTRTVTYTPWKKAES